MLWVAGLALGLQAVLAEIPVSFDHDGVILWTRVTPRTVNETAASYEVTWTVYSGDDLSTVVQTGVANTSAERDFTVKVDVSGLESGPQYAFRFQVAHIVSDVGTFRLPVPPGQRLERLKFFLYSCANWGFGYFNAYDVGSRYNLDFWVHLGDYFYEYGVDNYPSPSQAVRYEPAPLGLQPAHEILSLSDYRRRHALYRMDRGLQALSASAPLIALWDDHEFVNNVYTDGAENHDPEDGPFPQRKMNAAQAWHEWMPIRDTPSNFYAINRTLQFGDLATMFVLEDRVTARTNSGQNEPEGNPNDIPDVDSVVAGIVGSVPPSEWGQNVTDQLLELKNALDTRRTGANETMLGAAQEAVLARDTDAASRPGLNQTVWQQYLGGLVMLDRGSPDLEGAVAAVRRQGDSATADLWQEALDNLTTGTPGATYTSYSPTPYNLGNLTKSFPVSTSAQKTARANVALGRYKLQYYMDSWMGYIADRNRFLAAIANATNPVVYGGDTHNYWGGYIYSVDPQGYFGLNKTTPIDGPPAALEFDVGSVTSTGSEGSAVVPLEMINEAFKASSPGLLIADVRFKGGMYVELTQTNQHVEYIYVDTIATENYEAFCGMAYDAPARSDPSTELVIKPGSCGPVPEARPYQQALVLSEEARIVSGNGTNTPAPAAATAG
ncbi:hypothetical protein ABBQ32_006442 [Trebouxia sp. C0010 RCD-2024]